MRLRDGYVCVLILRPLATRQASRGIYAESHEPGKAVQGSIVQTARLVCPSAATSVPVSNRISPVHRTQQAGRQQSALNASGATSDTVILITTSSTTHMGHSIAAPGPLTRRLLTNNPRGDSIRDPSTPHSSFWRNPGRLIQDNISLGFTIVHKTTVRRCAANVASPGEPPSSSATLEV